jgi:hypothetical protein
MAVQTIARNLLIDVFGGVDDRHRATALDKGLVILELLLTQLQGLTRAEILIKNGSRCR